MWFIKINSQRCNLPGYQSVTGLTVQGVQNAADLFAKIKWQGGAMDAELVSLAEARANGWAE